MMPLTLAEVGEDNTVKRIGGKPEVRRHLENLGFVVGSSVTIINTLGDNVIVRVKEARVAIITNERYLYIASLMKACCKKKSAGRLSASDKIDKVVTNRFAALPIFAAVMFLIYWIAMGPFGSMLTDWANDVFGGEILQGSAESLMESWGAADWLSGLVAVSAYFIGVAAIIISGIMLKKTKPFTGEPAPFVMELPAYHVPAVGNVLRGTWERGWSFIKKAGTIILLSAVALWFLQGFGFVDGSFGMIEDNNSSLLAAIGGAIAFIFAPLGFGDWQSTVATVTGLIAKENVVTTFGVLFHVAGEVAEDTPALLTAVASHYSAISAYSFMIFNLLCAPCFAAMGAIRREMNNTGWTWAAIGYMCAFAYAVSLIVYQFGAWSVGAGSVIGTACAAIVLAFIVYMLLRPYKETEALKAAASCAN